MFVNKPTLPGPRKKLPRPVCHLLVLLSLDNSLLSLVPRVLKVSHFFIDHKIVILILINIKHFFFYLRHVFPVSVYHDALVPTYSMNLWPSQKKWDVVRPNK